MVATYSYDPWGALTAIGGTDPALAARQPLRYRSYYYDAESGLYRLPARAYDPATARFLTPDPAGPAAGDPLGLNRYSYCEDSPIAAADPSGATMDANGDGKIGSEDSIAESYEHATPRLKAYWWSSLHEAMKAAHTRDAIIEKAREKALAKLAAAKAARKRAREKAIDWAKHAQCLVSWTGVLATAVLLATPAGWAGAGLMGAIALGSTLADLGAGAARATLGDRDYDWNHFIFGATVAFVTGGVGGGAETMLEEKGAVAAAKIWGAAWGAADATMLITN